MLLLALPFTFSKFKQELEEVTHERILKELVYCFCRILFLVEVISQHKQNIVLFTVLSWKHEISLEEV